MQQTSTAEPRLTATPLGFGCQAKTAIHFLVQKTLVNTANIFWWSYYRGSTVNDKHVHLPYLQLENGSQPSTVIARVMNKNAV